MENVVTATEAKFRFGELLAEVSFGKRHIKIKKQKRNLAVMIPVDDYEEYVALKKNTKQTTRHELLRETMELVAKQKDPQPGAPDAVQIIRELRQQE